MDTEALAEAVLEPLAVPVDRMYRFSLDVYHGMIEHGLLTEHDKVVLLDGLLVKKMTKGGRHIAATKLVVKALEAPSRPAGTSARKTRSPCRRVRRATSVSRSLT